MSKTEFDQAPARLMTDDLRRAEAAVHSIRLAGRPKGYDTTAEFDLDLMVALADDYDRLTDEMDEACATKRELEAALARIDELLTAEAELARLRRSGDVALKTAAEERALMRQPEWSHLSMEDAVRLVDDIHTLEARVATKDAEIARLTLECDALYAKAASIATCACSVEFPDEVCMHHSPKLAAAEAELARLRSGVTDEMVEAARAARSRAVRKIGGFTCRDTHTVEDADDGYRVLWSGPAGTEEQHEAMMNARQRIIDTRALTAALAAREQHPDDASGSGEV